ncbi:hypothetical protein [Methylomonas koyamae]|uniref:hypothetical protein n=1 Tax=Methylomonas koyamae TaxID=702114 RepID=UPI001C8169DD|nr:hypothetical protein [Methylomonas koyamae]
MIFGGVILALSGTTQASVSYNLTGWDDSGTGGLDGSAPASWTGTSAPNYTGALNAMWFANLESDNASETVSSLSARSQGADPNFALAVGPRAWSANATGTLGKGHGSDFGLITLTSATNLTVTVSADTDLGSVLKPGFSLFQGWDTSTTAVRVADYQNNQDNPLLSQGLDFIDSAASTIAGGFASFTFNNLGAGNYTLFVGGNATLSAGSQGKYTVALAASPVPVPGAVWLFGTAFFGAVGIGKAKRGN